MQELPKRSDKYIKIREEAKVIIIDTEAVIKERIIDWTDGYRETCSKECEIKNCITQFNRRFGKMQIRRLGLSGWECGLCNMIDTNDEMNCKILPFVLTAYMYNFFQNRYVYTFLKNNNIKQLTCSDTEKCFCNEANETEPGAVGIGKMLSQGINPIPIELDEQFDRLVAEFFFHKTKSRQLKRGEIQGPTYILPVEKKELFNKSLKRREFSYRSLAKPNKILECRYEFADEEYDFYDRRNILRMFYCWYKVINDHMEHDNNSFCTSLDVLVSYVLLMEAFHDDEEISIISNHLECYSYEEVSQIIRNSIYAQCKMKRRDDPKNIDGVEQLVQRVFADAL